MRASFSLDLFTDLVWDKVNDNREFLRCFLIATMGDQEKAYNYSLALSELLENVCKYSPVQRASVSLKGQLEQSYVFMQVASVAERQQATHLQGMVTMVNEGQPNEAYLRMVQRSLENQEGSQLGLAMIRNNCNADINAVVLPVVPPGFLDDIKLDTRDLVLLQISLEMTA